MIFGAKQRSSSAAITEVRKRSISDTGIELVMESEYFLD
jgi:hypothetical protein